jgi:hypothetical protein
VRNAGAIPVEDKMVLQSGIFHYPLLHMKHFRCLSIILALSLPVAAAEEPGYGKFAVATVHPEAADAAVAAYGHWWRLFFCHSGGGWNDHRD